MLPEVPHVLRLLCVLTVLAGLAGPASASLLVVAIDTAALSGAHSQLAFDFTDGDGQAGNNTATIGGFSTDGVYTGSPPPPGVAGLLPGAVTLADSPLTELLQPIVLGATLSFALSLTENFPGGFPDQFALFLLDGAGASPLVQTDQPGGAGALFIFDVTGTPRGGPGVFAPAARGGAAWSVSAAGSAPEPPTAWLAAPGLAWLRGERRPAKAGRG